MNDNFKSAAVDLENFARSVDIISGELDGILGRGFRWIWKLTGIFDWVLCGSCDVKGTVSITFVGIFGRGFCRSPDVRGRGIVLGIFDWLSWGSREVGGFVTVKLGGIFDLDFWGSCEDFAGLVPPVAWFSPFDEKKQ